MKRYLLAFVFLFSITSSFTQDLILPCIQSYKTGNAGGGNCETQGGGSTAYFPGYLNQPEAPGYIPSGRIIVYFKTPIPIGMKAPEILEAGPQDPNVPGQITPGQAFNYRYHPFKDNISIERVAVEYCYYANNVNNNIFNGAKAPFLVFKVVYQASSSTTTFTCSGVIEGEEGTLPVSFANFHAARNKQTVALKWETVTEQNNRGFNVQRNTKGVWENIAFVFSAGDDGNSSGVLAYAFNDANPEKGVSQYRIQQVDLDGRASYSAIRSVKGEGQVSKTVVYPNPSAEGKVNVVFEDQAAKAVTVSDMSGRIVRQYRSVVNNVVIDGLETGMYTIQITDLSSAVSATEKVIIKKR
jgi:hypothetical protein